MSELPPPPPDQFSADSSNSAEAVEVVPTLMHTELGGRRRGGEMAIRTDQEPVVSGEEGFKIDSRGGPADLIAVIEAGEPGLNAFGVARHKAPDGFSAFVLVSLESGISETGNYKVKDLDDNGRPAAVAIGEEPIVIGSSAGDGLKDELGIKTGDVTLSRKHFSVSVKNGEVIIADEESTNGTKIESMGVPDKFTHEDLKTDMDSLKAELKARRSKISAKAGGVAVSGVVGSVSENVPVLIDAVPGAEEAPQALEGLKNARQEELNRPLEQQLEEFEQEFDEFRSQFTDDETINMWKYAAGMMNKRQAQQRGDGNGSYAEEKNAGEGLNALRNTSNPQRRQELLSAADKYLNYMQQISNLRARIM